MIQEFEENGYFHLKGIFHETELNGLREVVGRFHQSWVEENTEFYAQRAVNSAYLTAKKHLSNDERQLLFNFIGSNKLMDLVTAVLGPSASFMNTQLFFDPANKTQHNYWHRDPQYHLSIKEQKEALVSSNVIHFRIPLVDEPGLELIPGTHRRWDNPEEFDVRLEREGHKNHEDLASGVVVPLSAGDLLVFDANMIHRGIYGMNRLSLDILFCDPDPELLKFVEHDCLPDLHTLGMLENATAFENVTKIKKVIVQFES